MAKQERYDGPTRHCDYCEEDRPASTMNIYVHGTFCANNSHRPTEPPCWKAAQNGAWPKPAERTDVSWRPLRKDGTCAPLSPADRKAALLAAISKKQVADAPSEAVPTGSVDHTPEPDLVRAEAAE